MSIADKATSSRGNDSKTSDNVGWEKETQENYSDH